MFRLRGAGKHRQDRRLRILSRASLGIRPRRSQRRRLIITCRSATNKCRCSTRRSPAVTVPAHRSGGWSNWDTADLAADILFALGRAAARGVGHMPPSFPPPQAGAGVLADTGSAATGGLPESIGSDWARASTGNALPTATDALFGNGLGSAGNAFAGAGGDIGGGDVADQAAPCSPTVRQPRSPVLQPDDTAVGDDVLFGGASNAASGVNGLMPSEIGSAFSNARSRRQQQHWRYRQRSQRHRRQRGCRGVQRHRVSARVTASSILVTDGIGSLLGSLFD